MPRSRGTRGPDAYEIAVNTQQTLEAPPPRTMRPLKVLAVFAIGAIALALGKNGLPGDGPSVNGGCDKPALALDTRVLQRYGSVRWTIAGPAGADVVLALDSTAVPTGDALVRTVLKGCQAHGVVGIPAVPGQHTLTAYVVVDGRAQVAGTQPLEIVGP